MTDLPDGSVPRSNSEIASFHAHVYYDPNATRPEAERLRSWIDERFAVTLGRWHDVKVGPHDQAMFQVAFAVEVFPALVPWLMLNHGRSEHSGASEHHQSTQGSSGRSDLDRPRACRARRQTAGGGRAGAGAAAEYATGAASVTPLAPPMRSD